MIKYILAISGLPTMAPSVETLFWQHIDYHIWLQLIIQENFFRHATIMYYHETYNQSWFVTLLKTKRPDPVRKEACEQLKGGINSLNTNIIHHQLHHNSTATSSFSHLPTMNPESLQECQQRLNFETACNWVIARAPPIDGMGKIHMHIVSIWLLVWWWAILLTLIQQSVLNVADMLSGQTECLYIVLLQNCFLSSALIFHQYYH